MRFPLACLASSIAFHFLAACGTGRADVIGGGPGPGDSSVPAVDASDDVRLPDAFIEDAGTDGESVDAYSCPGCLAVATGIAPGRMVVGETAVYWVDDGTTMKTAPLDGGTVTTVASGAALGKGGVQDVAVDSANLYWITHGECTPAADGGAYPTCDPGVMRASLDGGAPTQIAAPGTVPLWNMALDTAHVYVSTELGDIMSIPLDGGPSSALAAASGLTPLLVDSTSLYYVGHGVACGGAGCASVMRLALDGGAPTPLVSGLAGPALVAVDADRLYYQDGAFTVMSVPVGGGAPSPVFSDTGDPSGVVLDSANAYWSEFKGDHVWEVPRDGGPRAQVAAGQMGVENLVLRASSLYWVVPSTLNSVGQPRFDGAIVRRPLN